MVDEVRRRYGAEGSRLLDDLDQLLRAAKTPAAVKLRGLELLLQYGYGRPQDVHELVPLETALQIVRAHAEAVRRHVHDPQVLLAIRNQFSETTRLFDRDDENGRETVADAANIPSAGSRV